MVRIAFVVGMIDRVSGELRGAGLFSSPEPTIAATLHCVTIAVGMGRDYPDGIDHLRRQFADAPSLWGWLPRLLTGRDDRARLFGPFEP